MLVLLFKVIKFEFKGIEMTDYRTAKLITLLQQEVNSLEKLIAILSDEKNALIERKFEALEDLANQKETLSATLEQSARERVELLQILLHNNDPKSALQAFLNHCSLEETAQINQLNNQLTEKIMTCRELNSINGQVITTNLNARQEIFNILNGQTGEDAINVYNAAGNVKASTESSRHQEA